MIQQDPWADPLAVPPEELARMAAQLEDRARLPDQVQVNALLLDMLAAGPGERILEAGSGTGVLCRQVAAAAGPDGQVYGVDLSPVLASAARQNAAHEGSETPANNPASGASEGREPAGHARLSFAVARAEALPFETGTFDAGFAARLLLHVPDARAAVRELARVVRPGGRVVLLDWDWETVTVDHADRALTRRILHWRCDRQAIDNWRGRQLLGLTRAAGLADITVKALAVVAQDENTSLALSLWRAADNARDAGAITVAEHGAWTGDLAASIAVQCFCASIVYFVVRGTRPEAGR